MRPGPSTPRIPKRCSTCGGLNAASFEYCLSCGAQLPKATAPNGTAFLHAVALNRPTARVHLVRPDGSEAELFTVDDEAVFGAATAGLPTSDDPYLSPRHCRFRWVDDRLQVEDLASRNGVYRRIRGEVTLEPGDQIRLGRQLLRIEPMVPPPPGARQIWGSPDPGYQARLIQVLQGGAIGEVYPLPVGETRIGRDQGNITFPSDRFVSGLHAEIAVTPEGYRLRDLGSSNGTFVRLAAPAQLAAGDYLLVGLQLLRIDLSA